VQVKIRRFVIAQLIGLGPWLGIQKERLRKFHHCTLMSKQYEFYPEFTRTSGGCRRI
jgi:hypothetical protein